MTDLESTQPHSFKPQLAFTEETQLNNFPLNQITSRATRSAPSPSSMENNARIPSEPALPPQSFDLQTTKIGKRANDCSIIEIETILRQYQRAPHRVDKRVVAWQLSQLSQLVEELNSDWAHRARIMAGTALPYVPPPPPSTIEQPDCSCLAEYETCEVCLEYLRRVRFPKRRITIKCDHEPLICLECLEDSITTSILDGKQTVLECPRCAAHFTYNNVKTHASPQAFKRYDQLLTHDSLTSLDTFRWCLNPNVNPG